MSRIRKSIGLMFMALCATAAFAQDVVLKPFILASKGPGDAVQKVEATKAALAKAGLTTVGQILEKLQQGDEALLAVEGFGRKSLIDTKKRLRSRGFDLPSETAEETVEEAAPATEAA